jgi:hypothetical protein
VKNVEESSYAAPSRLAGSAPAEGRLLPLTSPDLCLHSRAVINHPSPSESVTSESLIALETGALDPAAFPHSEHVRFGYEMLGRYSFGEAVTRFSHGLKLLAAKSGRPDRYHETTTVAFLALIGERRASALYSDWDEFKAKNTDLLDKHCLEQWYTPAQLKSDLARQTFCLPRPRSAGSVL